MSDWDCTDMSIGNAIAQHLRESECTEEIEVDAADEIEEA